MSIIPVIINITNAPNIVYKKKLKGSIISKIIDTKKITKAIANAVLLLISIGFRNLRIDFSMTVSKVIGQPSSIRTFCFDMLHIKYKVSAVVNCFDPS